MSNFVLGGCVRVDGVKGNVACPPVDGADTVLVAFADGSVRSCCCADVVRTKGRPKSADAMCAARNRFAMECASEDCGEVCESACDDGEAVCETTCDESLSDDCCEVADACCAAE